MEVYSNNRDLNISFLSRLYGVEGVISVNSRGSAFLSRLYGVEVFFMGKSFVRKFLSRLYGVEGGNWNGTFRI